MHLENKSIFLKSVSIKKNCKNKAATDHLVTIHIKREFRTQEANLCNIRIVTVRYLTFFTVIFSRNTDMIQWYHPLALIFTNG